MVRAWALAGALLAATGPTRMALYSRDFSDGAVIPLVSMAQACGGKSRSPELHWSGAPAGVKSFAIVLHDPDAPVAGGFYHWIAYDLPPAMQRLPSGATLSRGKLGETTLGRPGYYGPCPPPGPAHRYVFTLYALDISRLGAASPPTAPQLQRKIAGHVLAQAALDGTAAHP